MPSVMDKFPMNSRHILKSRHDGKETVFVSKTGKFGRSKVAKQCWETLGTDWATPASVMSALGWDYSRPAKAKEPRA